MSMIDLKLSLRPDDVDMLLTTLAWRESDTGSNDIAASCSRVIRAVSRARMLGEGRQHLPSDSTLTVTLDEKQVRNLLMSLTQTIEDATHDEVVTTCTSIVRLIAGTRYEHTGKRLHPGSAHSFTTLPPHDKGKVRRTERVYQEEATLFRDGFGLEVGAFLRVERASGQPLKTACDLVVARVYLAGVLPFAQSRAQDMHEAGGDIDPHWRFANSVISQAAAFLKRE